MSVQYNPSEYDGETLLGSGCRRDVYVYDETSVLKIDTEEYSGYRSNRSEIMVWDMVKDTDDARYFAAVLEYTDDGYIRMERVAKVGGISYDSAIFDSLCRIAYKYDVTDMHMGNIGQRADGSYCIIDYGAYMPLWRPS